MANCTRYWLTAPPAQQTAIGAPHGVAIVKCSLLISALSRRFPGNPGFNTLPRQGFSNQVGLILEPVARGLGFTVIPRYARQAFARQDAIQVVECGAPVVDTLWLIHRAEWPLSVCAAQAVELLRERIGSASASASAKS